MRKYNRAETVELLVVGGKIFVVFRDMLESISHAPGRTYSSITDSSLERLVDFMNDSASCEVEVRKDGRFISTIGWKQHPPKTYTEDEWKEMQTEKPDIFDRRED